MRIACYGDLRAIHVSRRVLRREGFASMPIDRMQFVWSFVILSEAYTEIWLSSPWFWRAEK